MLLPQTAQAIVDEVAQRLGHHINLMDRRGIIIGSSDAQRLHTVHQGAVRVLASGKIETLNSRQAARLPGTKPGVNAPIRLRGKVIGVVGITGSPSAVLPLAEAVVMLTELLLEQRETFVSELSRNEQSQQLLQQALAPDSESAMTQDAWLAGVRRLHAAFDFPVNCSAVQLPADQLGMDSLRSQFQREGVLQAVVGEWWWLLRPADQEDDFQSIPASLRTIIFPVIHSLPELRSMMPLGLTAARMVRSGTVDLRQNQHLALLASVPAEIRLAYGSTLSSLSVVVRETLLIWLASPMNVQAAARQLGIHRNTLLYRLGRIKQQTGADPLSVPGLTQLQLAVWCHQSVESPP